MKDYAQLYSDYDVYKHYGLPAHVPKQCEACDIATRGAVTAPYIEVVECVIFHNIKTIALAPDAYERFLETTASPQL